MSLRPQAPVQPGHDYGIVADQSTQKAAPASPPLSAMDLHRRLWQQNSPSALTHSFIPSSGVRPGSSDFSLEDDVPQQMSDDRGVYFSASVDTFQRGSKSSTVDAPYGVLWRDQTDPTQHVGRRGRPKAVAASQKDADDKFPCPHCNKTYLHDKHLKRHMLRRR